MATLLDHFSPWDAPFVLTNFSLEDPSSMFCCATAAETSSFNGGSKNKPATIYLKIGTNAVKLDWCWS